MKVNPTAIPQGTRTYLFEEAAHKRYLEQTLHSIFRSRGFQEIVTPHIEYYESSIAGISQEERNRLIRFTEGDSGRIIALRADITAQVARSAATHLAKRDLPLRLCYTGPVFRRARTGKGEQYVLHQVGLELLGHSGPEADVEAALSAAAALKAVSLGNFTLSLGHAGFVAPFLKGLDESNIEKIKKALGKKDKSALKTLLEKSGAPKEKAEKVIAITELYGGRETIEKAFALCSDPDAKAALENLKSIYETLEKEGLGDRLTVDLGEMRGFGYYTGLIMEIYSSTGIAIGSGGRYDNLVKRFGLDIPAVGFAFDIDKMIETLRKEASPPAWRSSDILLLDGDEETARKLREAGLMVTKPFETMQGNEAVRYAEKANIPQILRKLSDGKYSCIDRESGKEKNCTLQDFVNDYFK